MPTFSGQLRSRLSPLLPPRRRPLQSPPGRSARRQRRASVAFPSPPPGPPLQASPELSVAQTSPPGPARPSPRAPQTLSNPLGSRRLLGEETLAAAEAGATRLRAGRRRGARRLFLTPLLPRPGGRGPRRRLLSPRRWWPDGLVQRLQPTPFKGTRGKGLKKTDSEIDPKTPMYIQTHEKCHQNVHGSYVTVTSGMGFQCMTSTSVQDGTGSSGEDKKSGRNVRETGKNWLNMIMEFRELNEVLRSHCFKWLSHVER
ncbi:PREDICTED: uncharacterized protein LOC108528966 isoform X4 [Rhinopithecus bieti]|uniref:uncharacterized protein LOC108528966 isoform X4 n=1 Tax=Rhinopithecus bieti TaxID=61621 RepID=UPI00083C8CCE|nr:PREDICTED: uncharacterized protein LOC108528966 isoform X4 [Rhinopithecus bieti]